MRANQLRLWFASMAYVLLCALRRIGLDQKHFANATCGTIRLKLLKIGALVQFSVRRIKMGMASACPPLISGVRPPVGSPPQAPAARPPDTRRRIALPTRRHPKAHRHRFFAASAAQKIPVLRATTGATRKHVRNTRNMAIGLSAQSRIGRVRFMG
jgi:hypothetical protein